MRKFKFAYTQSQIPPATTTALRPRDNVSDGQATTTTTKRTRKSVFKVRTGCLTCKKRHVKCDEARPHCGNCVRSSKSCEGYPVVEGKRRNGEPLQHCWDAGLVVVATAPRPMDQMRLDPDLCDFGSGQSKTYFDAFVALLRSPWVVATSNGYLWGTTMPQVSRSSGVLRQIAIAIGALSMSLDEDDESTLKSKSKSGKAAGEHRIRALQHYGRSLKQLHAKPSVHDAVFLSLLSLRFETLQGNNRAALDHVNHGLALVAGLLTDDKGTADRAMAALAPNPKPIVAALAAVFTQLAPQARFIHRGRIQQTMPKDNGFAKKLAEKGHTLESFVILASHLLPRSSRHDDIPDKIASLDDFERHLSIQKRRLTNVPVGTIDNNKAYAALATNDTDLIDDYYVKQLTSDALKQGYETVLRDLERLDAAFLPLFNTITANSEPSSPMFLRALHLRLLFLQVYGFENPTQYLDHEALARQTPLFREYVSVARAALEAASLAATSSAQKGSLECNVAGHLMLAALFCRDQLVRDEATRVLATYPGRDGLWNTRGLYLVAVKSQEVERATVAATTEEGGGPAEQWSRMWRREYIFEDGGNRILYRHLRKDEASGEWRLVEEVADVPEHASEEVCWIEQPMTGYSKLIMGIMDE